MQLNKYVPYYLEKFDKKIIFSYATVWRVWRITFPDLTPNMK